MGLTTKNGTEGATPGAVNDRQGARFGAYFPRVFACAHSLTGDEATAREVVIEAFSRTFAHDADLSDDEFVMVLFDTARDLCRTAQPGSGLNGALSTRERELLAFVFDARLSRDVIRRLMRTSEQAMSSALLRALRKLRGGMTAGPNASLRLA